MYGSGVADWYQYDYYRNSPKKDPTGLGHRFT